MKGFLFVGLLLIVLVMLFSGNVQEGFTVDELTTDKATFEEAYERANNKTKGRRLENLTFPGGSKAGARMRAASYDKYVDDMKSNMTKGQILSKFDELIQKASSE